MLLPIRCFTCGCPLSELDKKWKEEKVKIFKSTPDGDQIDQEKLRDTLDNKLKLTHLCCRMHLISTIPIEKYN